MTKTMTTDQHIPVELSTFAADGVTPEPTEGPIVWASSDETVMHANVTDVAMGKMGFAESVAPSAVGPDGNPIPVRMTWTAKPVGGTTMITLVSEDIIVTMGVKPASVMKVTLSDPVAKV